MAISIHGIRHYFWLDGIQYGRDHATQRTTWGYRTKTAKILLFSLALTMYLLIGCLETFGDTRRHVVEGVARSLSMRSDFVSHIAVDFSSKNCRFRQRLAVGMMSFFRWLTPDNRVVDNANGSVFAKFFASTTSILIALCAKKFIHVTFFYFTVV